MRHAREVILLLLLDGVLNLLLGYILSHHSYLQSERFLSHEEILNGLFPWRIPTKNTELLLFNSDGREVTNTERIRCRKKGRSRWPRPWW
jgi:hypothetical protein